MNRMPKCPLKSAVDKEECIVAGVSVGGILQNDELIVDAWNDKPSDCFLTEGANIIHFNSNPVGARGNNYVSVCKEIEVRCNSIVLDQLHHILIVLTGNSYHPFFSFYFVFFRRYLASVLIV